MISFLHGPDPSLLPLAFYALLIELYLYGRFQPGSIHFLKIIILYQIQYYLHCATALQTALPIGTCQLAR